MSEAPQYVLFEHGVGYALFKVKEFEDIGEGLQEVEKSVTDYQRFNSIVQLHAFEPFKNTEAALDNCNAISEAIVHEDLQNFLDSNLPKKRKKCYVGVTDPKMGGSISESLRVKCIASGVVPEILRGVRLHFDRLVKDLPHHSLNKAQLSLGHSYSRGKVKFDVHRVDNMVIQAIALLDQLDKDINLFGMRIREWYAYHYPELARIVPEQYKYIKCALIIKNREELDEERKAELLEVLEDEEKVEAVVEGARTSMGMEITELDLKNIAKFAQRIVSLTDYRNLLHDYIKDRMAACAPSLTALVGEQVGARLISHAGSLTNLAKYPASTIQILGAEKALFRALKTRSNTPKYGLLFHSSFIGRASTKNKGRISRFLANKCSMASRLDCFSDVPLATYGEFLKGQVEERLTYFETGTIPKKNIEVMKEAIDAAEAEKDEAPKKARKAHKKVLKRARAAMTADHEDGNGVEAKEEPMEVDEEKPVASVDNFGPLSQLVLAFRAGSRYESNAEGGLVHHLRNAVGSDSQKYPGLSLVWSAAVAGGNMTSFATKDLFGVSLTVPRDQTSVALSILGHVAASPALKPWDVEEIADSLRADNAYKVPYNVVFDDIHRAAYRNGSLSRSTYSAKHQIGKIGYKTLQKFAAEHLVSGHAVLFGSNIEHERLVIYGDNHAPIQQGGAKTPEASPYKGGEFRRQGAGSLAHVILAGQGASGNDVKALATQAVLLSALGRDSAVRFSSVAGNGAIAKAVGEQAGVSSFSAVHQDSGLAGVYIVADGSKIQGAVSSAVSALKNFKAGDINVAKARASTDLLRGAAHSFEHSIERSAQLLSGVQDGAVVKAINDVSAADVEAAAKKISSKLSIASYGNINQVPYVDSL